MLHKKLQRSPAAIWRVLKAKSKCFSGEMQYSMEAKMRGWLPITVLMATYLTGGGCSCGEKTGGGDGVAEVDGDGTGGEGELVTFELPEGIELPDGAEGCDPSLRWCEGNRRYWCEGGTIHMAQCREGEYCRDGECLPRACEPGTTRCTPEGRIMTCDENGSGFLPPQDCPEGQICDGGVCQDIICTLGESYCSDNETEMRCNEQGTAWEEIECGVAYVCVEDECRLQICPPGMVQCLSDTSYHVCNESGTDYLDPVDCPPDTSCYEGNCLNLCQIADQTRSSVGCIFYAVDQHNRYDWGGYIIAVANTNDHHTANVTLQHRRGGTWSTVATAAVAPNSLHSFTPGNNSQVTTSNATAFGRGYGFKITSDVPIVAYQLNAIASCTGEGSMLIPYNGLDSSYYLVTYRGFSGPPLFTLVGAVDGTSVQITPSQNTAGGGQIPAITAGNTATITMDECDVAQVVATNVAGDLSGTRIVASNPIAVFTGSYCSHVPQGCTFCHVNDCLSCDPLEEQMIPKSTWGRVFVAHVVPEFNWGYFRIVAEQDNTTVNITLAPGTVARYPAGVFPPINLNAMQMAEFELGCTEGGGGCGLALLESTKPITLTNFIEGGQCRTQRCERDHCPGNYADPSMIVMPPVEQFMREYIFLTPNGFTNDYVTVIRETGSPITLDSAPLTATFLPVPGGLYEVAHVPVAPGTHHISGTLPFGIILGGYGYANSYGYAGGMKLEVINP